jgi:hypothetical protein
MRRTPHAFLEKSYPIRPKSPSLDTHLITQVSKDSDTATTRSLAALKQPLSIGTHSTPEHRKGGDRVALQLPSQALCRRVLNPEPEGFEDYCLTKWINIFIVLDFLSMLKVIQKVRSGQLQVRIVWKPYFLNQASDTYTMSLIFTMISMLSHVTQATMAEAIENHQGGKTTKDASIMNHEANKKIIYSPEPKIKNKLLGGTIETHDFDTLNRAFNHPNILRKVTIETNRDGSKKITKKFETTTNHEGTTKVKVSTKFNHEDIPVKNKVTIKREFEGYSIVKHSTERYENKLKNGVVSEKSTSHKETTEFTKGGFGDDLTSHYKSEKTKIVVPDTTKPGTATTTTLTETTARPRVLERYGDTVRYKIRPKTTTEETTEHGVVEPKSVAK